MRARVGVSVVRRRPPASRATQYRVYDGVENIRPIRIFQILTGVLSPPAIDAASTRERITRIGWEMAKFTTRVELHNASGSDYNKLHDEMEKEASPERGRL